MHAISSASPSHVHRGGKCYSIVAWGCDENFSITAVIIYDGLPFSAGPDGGFEFVEGAAPCIPVMEA